MLKVTGLIKVFALADGDKTTKGKGCWGTPPKDDNGEWENDFINVVFIGKAFDKVAEVNDKDMIYMTDTALRNRNYTPRNNPDELRTWTEIKIFDFVTRDEAEQQGLLGNGENRGNGSGSGSRRGSTDTATRGDRGNGNGSRAAARGNGSSRNQEQDPAEQSTGTRSGRTSTRNSNTEPGSRTNSSKPSSSSGSRRSRTSA